VAKFGISGAFKMECVMYSRFNELREHKMTKEKRNISLREVSRQTGLSLPVIQRAASNDPIEVEGLRLSSVRALVEYFDLGGVDQLFEYRKN
jgi:hypothetical protein